MFLKSLFELAKTFANKLYLFSENNSDEDTTMNTDGKFVKESPIKRAEVALSPFFFFLGGMSPLDLDLG